MSFEIKNPADGSVLNKHDFTAKDFDVAQLHENSFTQSLPFGETKVRQWIFDGIRINYSETEINELTEFNWKGDTEMVTMHFNLQGSISINDKNSAYNYELSGNEHNIFYGKEAEGTIKFDELKMKLFMIQLSKDAFLKIAEKGNDSIKRFSENVISGKSVAFSEKNGNIDLNLQQSINSILNCRLSDSLKRMFFYSKVIEILALQAESLDKATNQKTLYIKKEYDKERILFARNYLLQHIDLPPTIPELSMIAGINEYKLKRGFKETFGQTIFEYLSEVRLELAKNDLLEKHKTVTQIAFELGYSSPQHFSSAFKKKFDISPGKAK
ncbi:MAG: helix-turn-helix transcriptional regulator [Flavobacterium sp.]